MYLPPYGIKTLNPKGLPLVNTFILITSGFSITWAHHALLNNRFEQTRIAILTTIFYALFFTCVQIKEYLIAEFTIADSVYGSCFYMITVFMVFM